MGSRTVGGAVSHPGGPGRWRMDCVWPAGGSRWRPSAGGGSSCKCPPDAPATPRAPSPASATTPCAGSGTTPSPPLSRKAGGSTATARAAGAPNARSNGSVASSAISCSGVKKECTESTRRNSVVLPATSDTAIRSKPWKIGGPSL